MGALVIGALRVDLGLDSAAFTNGTKKASSAADALKTKLNAIGAGLRKVGAGLSVGVTAPLVAFGKSAFDAAIASADAIGQMEAALASMGPKAGLTSEQLQKLAKDLEKVSSFDDKEILRKVTSNLLTFGNVAGDAFIRAQRAAVDMASRLGQDPQNAAIMLGKALNDPIKGLTALSRVGVQFTADQKKTIEGFVKSGQVAKAQAVILDELEQEFKGAGQAVRDAAPGSDTANKWSDLKEKVGEFLLDAVAKLEPYINSILDSFNNLSPEMQNNIIIVGGLAAALGPLLIILGAMATAVGALASPIGLVVLALAALAAAWAFWPQIEAYIKSVGDAISEWYDANIKPTFDKVMAILEPFIKFFADYFGAQIEATIKIISGILSGDWETAWEGAKEFVTNTLKALGTAMAAIVPGIIETVKGIYTGIKQWLQDKLGAIFDWIKGKLTAVGDYFKNLWDRVVGHSYIPDMVDGIEHHMNRLDKVLVEKVEKTTSKAAKAFREFAGELKSLLERLFTEVAEGLAYRADKALIEKAVKLGKAKGGLSEEEAEDVLARLRRGEKSETPLALLDEDFSLLEEKTAQDLKREIEAITYSIKKDLEEPAKHSTVAIAQYFAQMAEDVLYSLRDMVSQFKHGDIFGGIMSILSLIGQVGTLVAGITGKANSFQGFGQPYNAGGTPGINPGAPPPSYGGPRALGGPVVPGKYYAVGERGREYFTPDVPGQISPELPGGRNVYNFKGNLLTAEFWAQIQAMDDQTAIRGAMGGANIVRTEQNRRSRQALGRRR